jgi:repressor LexA
MFMEILDRIGAPVFSSSAPRFTEKQGQYLAFIATYTLLNGRPPAEADFQRFFQVTPPAVHQMIVELERRGLISRIPGQPRTIKVTVPDDEPPLCQRRLRQSFLDIFVPMGGEWSSRRAQATPSARSRDRPRRSRAQAA